MNPLITIITCLHVLAHSVFGCCGEHGGHAGTLPKCCQRVQQQIEPAHAEHVHHHGSTKCPDDASEPCDSVPSDSDHDCPHAFCQWLDSKPLCANELIDFPLNLTAQNAPAVLSAVALGNATTSSPCDFLARPAALPLRLHLAVCVLLI